MKKITIAIDFEGVIRDFNGNLIDNTKEAMDWLKGKGYKLIITTAKDDLREVKRFLEKEEINYPIFRVPKATAYINDRAIRFTNWKDITSYY